MTKHSLTLSILVTTIDEWIDIVISKLLPQLWNCDEVIISHQIRDKKYLSDQNIFPDNVKYVTQESTGLSKNRNHALSYASWDICYICDDDIYFNPNFQDTILQAYEDNSDADIITFEAGNELWNKRFGLKSGKHNPFSFLKISSIWITLKRKTIQYKKITFNENFGLGTQYPIWEEAIFLKQCYSSWCNMTHNDSTIVTHPDESTGKIYTETLAVARIMLWKELFGFLWWLFACVYFIITHYKLYKNSLWFKKTFTIFLKSLFRK